MHLNSEQKSPWIAREGSARQDKIDRTFARICKGAKLGEEEGTENRTFDEYATQAIKTIRTSY